MRQLLDQEREVARETQETKTRKDGHVCMCLCVFVCCCSGFICWSSYNAGRTNGNSNVSSNDQGLASDGVESPTAAQDERRSSRYRHRLRLQRRSRRRIAEKTKQSPVSLFLGR